MTLCPTGPRFPLNKSSIDVRKPDQLILWDQYTIAVKKEKLPESKKNGTQKRGSVFGE